MAVKKTAAVFATADAEEMVEVRIPRGQQGEDPNYFVSINDYTALLPRGKVSKVPKWVAEEIERSTKAEEHYFETMDKMIAQTEG